MFELVLHSKLISKHFFFDSCGSRKASSEESESDVITHWELIIKEAKPQMSPIFSFDINKETIKYFLLKVLVDLRYQIDRYFEELMRNTRQTEEIITFRHKNQLVYKSQSYLIIRYY